MKSPSRIHRLLSSLAVLVLCSVGQATRGQSTTPSQATWSPVADSMLTKWGESVTPENAWRQYPRPQMVRPEWTNLNGLWDYAVVDAGAPQPRAWDGSILVPFAIESPLSGVGKRLTAKQALWYHRSFESEADSGERTLLHFEAVDYDCAVFVNGTSVGRHVGGNLPFSFDVTESLVGGQNELVVKVLDSTDEAGKYQLRGKQKQNNRGIFYTPVSGIHQTVWLETVPASSISDLRIIGNADGKVTVDTATSQGSDQVRVSISLDGRVVVAGEFSGSAELTVPNPQLWSPSSPTLYDLKVELIDESGEVLDIVTSYVGLRTVGKRRDASGDWRMTLNGETIFHWGPLDQGWWPDGLLTPPSEEAYLFEIGFLKRAGFNMIRKHIKVEPRRYYYQCDRLGMMVWQDQVEGGAGFESGEWPRWKRLAKDYPQANKAKAWKEGQPLDADWPDQAHQQYMAELKGMVDNLHNHPSIVCWVPFNERWGQHRTMDVGKWIVDYDPTRLINIASGGNFFPVGDMADEHVYPHPDFPTDDTRYDDYVKIVGEFGGHGWPVPNHQWKESKRRWGYGGLPATKEEYIQRYEESIRRLGDLKRSGVAGAVYTQTTDVEGEINGLMTYDRKVIKISAARLAKIAAAASLTKSPSRLSGKRPNIIMVLVDDMGYSDLGCYGGEIQTPHIDALAAGGLRFTQFYNQGRCCPTRASLITGLQPHQVGIGHMTAPPNQPLGFTGAYQGYLNDQCTTVASVLKSAGYTTLMTGKWHLGADRKECWPLQRGFDKYYGCISGAINYFKPGGNRGVYDGNDRVDTPEDFYATDAFTDQACQYISEVSQEGDAPFFLYLAYNAPHWPLNAKWSDYQKYRGKYAQGWRALMAQRQQRQREMGLFPKSTIAAPHPGPQWDSLKSKQRDRLDAVMAAYAGCVDSIDQNIGKLVNHLKVTGEYENTVIFFLSDNGACQDGGDMGRGDDAMVKDPPLETTGGVRLGLNWAAACNTP
ncbi:MAG: sulfatase-like hydrolase/transferase, partial [Planctomycetota bacterium]